LPLAFLCRGFTRDYRISMRAGIFFCTVLPRRANQEHIGTIAKIVTPARSHPDAGFLFSVFRIGRRPHVKTLHSPSSPRRRQRAAVRATFAHRAGLPVLAKY
jgi:hypothetical protein